MEKKDALINWFKSHTEGHLLFSGGFDSSAVLGAAMQAKANITPIWVNNGFNRVGATEMALQARKLGAPGLKTIEVEPGDIVVNNPERRCYYCKGHILSLVPKDGKTIYDGTTASDLANYRPGKQALDEYKVQSPLAQLGITSWETKDIALAFGADPLFAEHESCLATRINYNYLLTPERIKAIYNVENYIINETGDFHVRCRIDDEDHMRIEVSKPESYALMTDASAREALFEMGSKACLFVAFDVKRSRPNEYDKRIKE